jgi:sigma-B regulation protein RsbU (phosphoserine phosphatase)
MTTRSWRPSISVLIAMIVVSPIIIVSLILASLSWAASARVAEDLGQAVMSGAAASVAAEVRNFLDDAVRVSDRYARRIESGLLPDPPPTDAWERAMLDDIVTTPTVASICYGTVGGDATWLLRRGERTELGRALGARAGAAVEYIVDPRSGQTIGAPLRNYTYDPRQRPWYAAAVSSPVPRWTPIYAWFADSAAETTIGTGYTRQLRSPDGNARGVLVIDVTLGGLGDFLRRMEIAKQGQVFIVDAEQRLVASSRGRVTDDAGKPLERLIPGARTTLDGAAARASVTRLQPYPGIDWRVVAMLPESSFLADAQRVRLRAVVASVVAVAIGLLIGLALARYLSRPIQNMSRHVKRVGAGDFDARLDLTGARELTVLSDEINRMAAGLRQRMVLEQSLAVAMEVQQSLLPAADPRCGALDVAGCSKYCDSTGGDYFDFIDVAPLSESSLLVAVGDVMGHGIAAALLMATARGALRCAAADRPALGQLMTRANDILAADNRHNRFMTLALLRIDGQSRTVRWASAGHDAAIVYEPVSDTFKELEGGDMPLGVTEGVEFEEYRSDPLSLGSVMVVGTDGVWEMMNEAEEQYGKDRLRAVMRAHHGSGAKQIADAIQTDLAAYRGAREPADDVTFVVVKFSDDGRA